MPIDAHIHVGVDGHDDNDNVERVDQKEVNHFEVGCFWYHFVNCGLNC